MLIILKLNRIILVSILLLIFIIGAVSAADENITDTTDEVLSAEPIGEVLSAEPVEELEETQPEDFSELVTLIKNTSSGKTLTLDKDYINDGTYTKGILISKKMTIDGQGHTLDANGKSNIFRIGNNQVTLKNINFINSYSKDYSAVYGTCTVINCTFTDSTSEKDGGALYGGTAYNSTFTNCNAYLTTYGDEDDDPFNWNYVCRGGAIYNGDAYGCFFTNCNAKYAHSKEILNNNGKVVDVVDIYANGCGGAIYEGTAYDCSFMNCSSVDGGAIYNGDAYNCSFITCSVSNCGGAIYNGTAHDSSFVNCKAERSEDELRYYYSRNHDSCKGGAIYNGDAYSCSFKNCLAKYYYQDWEDWDSHGLGGAVYHGNAHGCSFENCYSVGGGAIIGNAYNSSFKDCSAFGSWSAGVGGAIQGNAYNCSFTNCRSEYGGSLSGGNAYSCSFIGGSVIDGAGGSSGGALYYANAYDCYFERCSAYEGAAIFAGNATGCSFVNCTSLGGGGGIIHKGNAFDSIFINCTTKKKGIIVDGNYSNCTFIPITLSCSNLTVSYGEGKKLEIRAIDANGKNIDGESVNVKIYKDNKLINSFSTTSGTDLPIDAAPGSYIISLTCANANPLNVSLVVNKGSPKLELANNFAKSGETANVKVTLSKKATGFVRITINGETYRVQISSGVASVDVANLADGAYTVKATYGGNVYFNAETMTDTFHVGKYNQGMKLAVKNIKVGETERLTATLAKDATGFVRFIIGNDTYKVAIENGVAYVDLKDLKAGTYGVTLKYGGNYKYNAETISKTFTVSKSSPGITITANNINVGQTATIKVDLAKDVPGNVLITVNGESQKVKINNGEATLTLSGLKEGTYNVSAKYAGNYKYNAETKATSFTASKSSPAISIKVNGYKDGGSGSNIKFTDNITIEVDLANDVPGNVLITVNGQSHKIKINNGIAILNLSAFAVGTYDVTVKYAGNYKYNAESKTISFTVSKLTPTMSVSAETENGQQH